MNEEIKNIKVSKGIFDDKVEITWDGIEGVEKYGLLKRHEGGDFEIIERDLHETKYDDYAIKYGIKYQYEIKYFKEGRWSNAFVTEMGFVKDFEEEEETREEDEVKDWKEHITPKRFFMVIALISIFYTLFLTNMEYVSNSKIIIRETNTTPTASSLIAMMNPNVTNKNQNVKILETFLHSRELYKKIDDRFKIGEYFRSKNINFYDRLSGDDTIEDYLILFDKKINFVYDVDSDIISIDFYHTDSGLSQEIMEYINGELISLINKLNQNTGSKKLKMIEEVIDSSKEDYMSARRDLEQFQSKYKTVSPKDDILKKLEMVMELEKEIEKIDNEIREKKIYMNPDHYEITNLEKLKAEYERKHEEKTSSLIGVEKRNVNLIINDYEELKGKLLLQKTILSDALTKQTNMRIEIQKEKLILEVIISPTLGEDYASPNKFHNIIMIILLSFISYFIFNVIMTIVREKKY